MREINARLQSPERFYLGRSYLVIKRDEISPEIEISRRYNFALGEKNLRGTSGCPGGLAIAPAGPVAGPGDRELRPAPDLRERGRYTVGQPRPKTGTRPTACW